MTFQLVKTALVYKIYCLYEFSRLFFDEQGGASFLIRV